MSHLPTPPAVRILEDEETGRRVVQIHYSALGPVVTKRIRQRAARKYSAGVYDPIFQADYELSLTAQPGEIVFKSFGDKNVGDIEILPGRYPQILSFDFGFDHPTCILVGQQTPKQLQIYAEHYLSGATAKVHKARLRKRLLALKAFVMWVMAPEPKEIEPIFRRTPRHERRGGMYAVDVEKSVQPYSNPFDHFTAVGDVSGAGYIAEYAEEPYPIHIGPPSQQPGWRDKDGMESILDGLFRRLKRCCWYVWPDEQEKCGKCQAELQVLPGVVIDPGCQNLRLEIPAQVIDDTGKRKKNIPDHAVDALLYMSRYAMDFRLQGREKKKTPDPWWTMKPKEYDESDDEDSRMYGNNAAVIDFFR